MTCDSKTFCMHPFTGLATREDGAIQVCCRSHPIGWIQNETLEEVWNNENIKRIRKQVLTGERPKECEPCFSLEDQGVESLRERHIKGVIPEARINLYPNSWRNVDENFAMPYNIPTMEIKLNNLCNLKCRMCHPMDSTSWNDWDQVEEFYKKENNFMVKIISDLDLKRKPYLDKFDDNPNWWSSFEKNLPNFRRVEFAGGEPLMDPQHYRILDMLEPYGKDIEIKYATNGTTLGIKGGRSVHEYWPKFRSVAVNVSIDGIGPVYSYIRGNGDWDTVVQNVQEIQKIPNVSRVVGAVAVQVGNIMSLDKIIEYFLNDLGIVFFTNMVKYPNVLSVQVMPEPLKKIAAERLQDVRDKVPGFKLVREHPMLKDLTINQINGIIRFMYSDHRPELWADCIEFNRRLDTTRKQDLFEVVPEFKAYV